MLFTRYDEAASPVQTDEILRELSVYHLRSMIRAHDVKAKLEAALGLRVDTEWMHEVEADPNYPEITWGEDWLRNNALYPYAVVGEIDYATLVAMDLDYSAPDLSASDVIEIRQVLAFWSKRADIVIPGVDKEKNALTKFVEAERLCAETNDVFRKWGSGEFRFTPDVDGALYIAQRKIGSILGDVPSLGEIKIRFGPGATTQVKKADASPRAKLGQPFACSEELLPVMQCCLQELPSWTIGGDEWPSRLFTTDDQVATVSVEVHPGRLYFVPKNAKTHRSVMVEPSLNSMFQLGIGDHMAGKLRQHGIDIRDQTRNQSLARLGSLTGDLATLDLSSASDTIARELVFHLLPVEWALFLDQFCTRTVIYGSSPTARPVKLQKFSTMGNGFTFPLETLIFYGLAVGCTPREQQAKVSVYGDDIIVPTNAVPLLVRTLTACGFIVNQQKSFVNGPFRESCGRDYLSGIDVRPCYIKDRLLAADLFRLHNFYARSLQQEPAAICLRYLSDSLCLWGPDGYGDGHLVGDWQPRHHRRATEPGPLPAKWGTFKWRDLPDSSGGWGGYLFDTYTWRGISSPRTYPGDRVLPCYSIYVSEHAETRFINTYAEVLHRITGAPRPVPKIDFCVIQSVAPHENQGVGRLEWRNRSLVHGTRREPLPSNYRYDKQGRLSVVTPGRKGYKRTSIYTLRPA